MMVCGLATAQHGDNDKLLLKVFLGVLLAQPYPGLPSL